MRLDQPPPPGRVQAVASEGDVVVVHLANATAKELSDLAALLDGHGISSRSTALDGGRGWFLVSLEDAHTLRRCWSEVTARYADRARLEEGLGTLSAVGAGIHANHRNLRVALEALEAAAIPVAGVFTTSYRLGFLVPKAQVKDGVRALHAALVG